MNKLGTIIKTYRINKNYNQKFVSKSLGINQSTYSRIENGTIIPNIETLYKLSKLLSFSIDKILEMTYEEQKIYEVKSLNLKNHLILISKNHKE